MKIEFVNIQNFRKLKNCRIDFSDKETVFVGANNSGKTTAMDALIKFFKARTSFKTQDFTLSNWTKINSIGDRWLEEEDVSKIDFSVQILEDYLPTIDIWLNATSKELHYINDLIPTLDWEGGSLGVRLRFEPDNLSELYQEFLLSHHRSENVIKSSKNSKDNFRLWPKHLWDFLDKKLLAFFSVKTYLLDPALKNTPQKLSSENLPLEVDAFNGLIKVDIINAQRGFSDVDSDASENSNAKNLSSQLRSYYDKHLNPSVNPTSDDIEALRAIDTAKTMFDQNLNDCFAPSLRELQELNYPGFGNPTINLSSRIDTVESLNHGSSVLYNLNEDKTLNLPERYNGLGYQNLISMIFKLIRFRDEWMRVKKDFENENPKSKENEFEPLHLVLIEEPEAHLHAQVQQVFINSAYNVLRNHEHLLKNSAFSTQLVVSTHSNHIAHEINFTCLRYFKRQQPNEETVHTSTVVNLSKTFGNEDETTKFAKRYLKSTHCDLFFADAVIMVEGPAERMLVPYFISHHTNLCSCYISILEIGGSHAHTLKPLIESLGIITLVVTDLDAIDPTTHSKAQPEKIKGLLTGNDTLKKWLPALTGLDELLELKVDKKESIIHPIRVAYQIPLKIQEDGSDVEVYPYTFEDSLVMENKEIFNNLLKGKGLLKRMIDASKETNVRKAAKDMYETITDKNAKKAEFALELFYFEDPKILKTPSYIHEGLKWLEEKLIIKKEGLMNTTNTKV